MTSSDRTRATRIANDARRLQLQERQAFIDVTCAGNEALRWEVESLLHTEDEGLTKEISSSNSRSDDSGLHTSELAGQTVGHYHIIEKIGAGGMGTVFVAEDLKLRRRVALKALPDEWTREADRKKRFIREARAAAAIHHAHIAAIYSIDEIKERTFIAMELVDGEALLEWIKRGAMPLDDALRIASQIAKALVEVHGAGLVHRDLKPANVMVTRDRQAKLIDFGLAKPVGALTQDDDVTRDGIVLGSVSYMSPEQIRNEPLDERSDVFAFGAMLFEMLTGRRAFKRDSQVGTVSAILDQDLDWDALRQANVPDDLISLIERMVAGERSERPQRSCDVFSALQAIIEARRPATRAVRPIVWTGAILIIAAAVGMTGWLLGRAPPAITAKDPIAILISDFQNRTGVKAFDGAIEQTLCLALEQASYINCFGRPKARQAAARLDQAFWKVAAEGGGSGRLDSEHAQLVARSEGIEIVIDGSVEPRGDGFLIKVSAFDSTTSETIAEARATADDRDSVLPTALEIARALRDEFGEDTIDANETMAMETFSTGSLDAMHAYARGNEALKRQEYEGARAAFGEAIAADPKLGRAYSGLAVIAGNQGQVEKAEEYFQKALANLDRMSERERRRTRGHYFLTHGNYQAATEEYRAVLDRYPADDASLGNLPIAYAFARDMPRALKMGLLALERHPGLGDLIYNVAWYATFAGEFDVANEYLVRARDAVDNKTHLYTLWGLVEAVGGNWSSTAKHYELIEGKTEWATTMRAIAFSDLAIARGQPLQARATMAALLEGAEKNDKKGYATALLWNLDATVAMQLGDPAGSLSSIDAALSASQHANVLVESSLILLQLGELARVEQLVEKLERKKQPDPRSAAFFIRGSLLARRDQIGEAVESFAEGRKLLDSWLGRYLQGTSYLLAESNLEASVEFEACKARVGEAASMYLDDFPSLRHVVRIDYELGRAYQATGSTGMARTAYSHFVDSQAEGADAPTIIDVRKRLSELDR